MSLAFASESAKFGSRLGRACQPLLDPALCLVKVGEHGWTGIIDAAEPRLQEPHPSQIPVVVREVHQHGDEEPVREHQLALGVETGGGDLYRL